jgi:hypothetical protein
VPSGFEFDTSDKLTLICSKTGFRKKVIEFSYGPFTHYHMRFTESSNSRLRGKMLLVQQAGGKEIETEVGDVLLERE